VDWTGHEDKVEPVLARLGLTPHDVVVGRVDGEVWLAVQDQGPAGHPRRLPAPAQRIHERVGPQVLMNIDAHAGTPGMDRFVKRFSESLHLAHVKQPRLCGP
jgi:hypothetical protein